MISACLALMFLLVIMRPGSALKPSWLATLAGALSISTWGFLGVSAETLDSWIGGANRITLVRDMLATLSFWFYREAIAKATGTRPLGASRDSGPWYRRIPWLLLVLLASYALPFALIEDPGATSEQFVLDRLGQTQVWLFGVLYMCSLIFLSIDAIRMLRRPRGVLLVISTGYVVVVVGCLVEVIYLTAAHFGIGGPDFRSSMYFAAELPFFTGIFIIGAGILWNAIRTWSAFRPTLITTLQFANEVGHLDAPLAARLKAATAPRPRRRAFRLLVEMQDALEIGKLTLTSEEHRRMTGLRQRFGGEIS